jgi:hypothetical protein
MLDGLQHLNLLAPLPDPQTIVCAGFWQQLTGYRLQYEPLEPTGHGVYKSEDFPRVRVHFSRRVFIFRIYTKAAPVSGADIRLSSHGCGQADIRPGTGLRLARRPIFGGVGMFRCHAP